MMMLSEGRKLFQVGLAVLIPACDGQPPSQLASQTRCRSKYRAYCVAQVIKQFVGNVCLNYLIICLVCKLRINIQIDCQDFANLPLEYLSLVMLYIYDLDLYQQCTRSWIFECIKRSFNDDSIFAHKSWTGKWNCTMNFNNKQNVIYALRYW